MFNRFITPKSVIAATVAACVVAVAAIGTIGAQSYFAAQAEARIELSDATADAAVSERNVDAIVLQAEQAIAAAQAVLANSEGKTLDATAREQLKETLDKAIIQLELLKKNGSRIDERVLTATRAFNEQILWPPTAQETAKKLRESTSDLGAALTKTLGALLDDSEAVIAAQSAWQAEQDRIAAEAAAKAAAEEIARRAAAAAASSTLKPSGGSTAPNVQVAPVTQTIVTSFAESFLRQYVSTSQASLTWNASLCQPGYICGITTVGRGIPVITLMGTADAPANYDWAGGRYVLVHEAAHARQWWLYGSVAAMISESERFTASMGITGVAAVEYMADCATIVKIGYAGTYTATCTAEQLAEAARVW